MATRRAAPRRPECFWAAWAVLKCVWVCVCMFKNPARERFSKSLHGKLKLTQEEAFYYKKQYQEIQQQQLEKVFQRWNSSKKPPNVDHVWLMSFEDSKHRFDPPCILIYSDFDEFFCKLTYHVNYFYVDLYQCDYDKNGKRKSVRCISADNAASDDSVIRQCWMQCGYCEMYYNNAMKEEKQ